MRNVEEYLEKNNFFLFPKHWLKLSKDSLCVFFKGAMPSY